MVERSAANNAAPVIQAIATNNSIGMNLPPHIQEILAGLRDRGDVPESLFELFDGLKSIDPSFSWNPRPISCAGPRQKSAAGMWKPAALQG